MLVALYNRTFETDDIPTLQKIIHQLSTYTVRFVFFEDFYTRIKDYITITPERIELFSSTKKLPSNTDMLISFGGDGTILDTILFVGNSNIPVVGINLGRLGFLAAISEDDATTTIHALMHGAYNIEKRSLLHLDANCELFGTTPFGLNEFTIHRKDSSSMIKIHTYLNGEFLNTYWADGLIVATPTGSTGYSLSCGGPVVFPQASNFIITPVAPHNLNLRSIIVPDDVIISFEVEGRADTFLCTLDSRSETITSSAQIAIRKENFSFSFIRPHDHNFLKTIRQKLYWGVDRRN
jgi:NAD+ kinase